MKNSVALIIAIAYPILSYLAWEFVLPTITAVIAISNIHFTEFPLTILHGFIVVFLWVGFFSLFLLGLYIWVLSIRQSGAFLRRRVFMKAG